MDWQAWLTEQSTTAPRSGHGLLRGSLLPRPPWVPQERLFDDLLVKTINPEYLAQTLAQLPMSSVAVLTESWDGEVVTVRCYNGCIGFVSFAIDRQGYGEVIR